MPIIIVCFSPKIKKQTYFSIFPAVVRWCLFPARRHTLAGFLPFEQKGNITAPFLRLSRDNFTELVGNCAAVQTTGYSLYLSLLQSQHPRLSLSCNSYDFNVFHIRFSLQCGIKWLARRSETTSDVKSSVVTSATCWWIQDTIRPESRALIIKYLPAHLLNTDHRNVLFKAAELAPWRSAALRKNVDTFPDALCPESERL